MKYFDAAFLIAFFSVIVYIFAQLPELFAENKLRPSTARFCKIESINENEKCVYERKGK
jgi:hypothetical protein